MADRQTEPPYKPRLRPHRLIPAPGAVPAEGMPVAAIERQVESWLEASSEMPTPALADGGRALAQQAWLFIERAALTIDALPAVFRSSEAPDEALQTVELISSILLAFPDLMASGLETNIARVDWMFSQLINAPGHPGLVELVIETLDTLDTSADMPETDDPETPVPAEYGAEIAVLRGLHRDLVTLQQRWDELIEATFPVVLPTPANPPTASDSKTGPVGVSIGAQPGQPVPKEPAPLPAGLLLAQHLAGGPAARSFRSPGMGRHQQRLALLAALVLLIVTVIGLLLAQARNAPTLTPGNAALSVVQHTPTPSAPTRTQATPTPTQAAPTPTTQPPTPTPRPPTPTPNNSICPNGAVFCVSTTLLQVPCAGEGSVTFQLMSNASSAESWQASSLFGARVTITPARGTLKQGQTVTLSVQAATNRGDSSGTLMILGPFGTTPISVAVQVCS